MKKIFSVLFLMAGWSYLQAQTTGAVVTTVPSSFTAEDVVKIIVDVSKVGNLKGKEPLYVWTWEPNDPPAAPQGPGGNGAWDNSNEAMKMVKEGPDRWSWTITPSQFYNKPPGQITKISFLVKAKNGNGDIKTSDISLDVAPLVYIPSVFRTFPKVVGQEEVITFYLDQTLATDVTTQRMVPQNARISLYAESELIDAAKTVPVTKQSDKVYSGAFYPPKLFAIPANKLITKMKVVFLGKGKDANGNDINVESVEFEYGFDELK
jgi:hypothetical protein